MENPPKCPRCSSDEVLPIAYGMPSEEMFEEAERGEIVLGGCGRFIGLSPDYTCQNCGHEWR